MSQADEYTNAATGYIEGYAMRPERVKEAHDEAWAVVKKLDRNKYVLSVTHLYGRNVYVLSGLVTGFTPLQKLVIANGGPCPFGGVVKEYKVEIYND